MRKFKQYLFILTLVILLVSCSSTSDNTDLNFSDENLSVSCNISDFEQTAFNIILKNNSDKEILLLITEAKVLTSEGEYVNIMRLKDAISKKTSVTVKNMKINPGIVMNEEFVAIGFFRKQILKNEYVILPWIDSNNFKISIPYIIDNRKKVIEMSL